MRGSREPSEYWTPGKWDQSYPEFPKHIFYLLFTFSVTQTWPHTSLHICSFAPSWNQLGTCCLHSKWERCTEDRNEANDYPRCLLYFLHEFLPLWYFGCLFINFSALTGGLFPFCKTHGFCPLHPPLTLGYHIVQMCQHGSRNQCEKTCYIAQDFVTEPYGIST